MPSLLTSLQEQQIRDTMTDIADTWPFPITLIRVTHSGGAFSTNTINQEHPLTAIRDFTSSQEDGAFRNTISTQNTSEFTLYIGWKSLENEGLIDANDKAIIGNNDLIRMENEIYEITGFAGVGDMLTRPTFLKVLVKRRYQSSSGASDVG